jgi:lysophospholipase L1-like esterase
MRLRGLFAFMVCTVWVGGIAHAACPPVPVMHLAPARWDITAAAPAPGEGPTAGQFLDLALAAAAPPAVPGDVASLCRYRAADAALPVVHPPRVVLMGDSITEYWGYANPALFARDFVDRGIAGQLSWQMLLRFRQDVLALHPQAVLILAGTNDLNGPPGASQVRVIADNIQSMAELARANHIAVVLGTVPPMGAGAANQEKRGRILALNRWLAMYARQHGLGLADFYSVLATRDGVLDPQQSIDALHPNRRGYDGMEALLGVALARLLL